MEEKKTSSFDRVIHAYKKLKADGFLEPEDHTTTQGKHRETVKRYVRHIKSLAELDGNHVFYRREHKRYELEHNEEYAYHIWVLAILLYGSRSLCKEDVETLIDFLYKPFSRKFLAPVRKLVSSHKLFFKPMTDVPVFDSLRPVFKGIIDRVVLKMTYRNHQGKLERHEITPHSVSYDQGYFYVIADSLTDPGRGTWNFRLDRIQSIKATKKTFAVNQHGTDFFEAGEHTNLSFLMHGGGKKTRVKLKVESWLVQYMIDQFPYHEQLGSEGDKQIYNIYVMDEDSVLFWVLKQRTWVEVLEPETLRQKTKETIQSMMKMYE